MSRTNRGSKPQGFDMWGKRPCAGEGNDSKRICRKIERQQGKQLTQEEVDSRHENVSVDDGSLADEFAQASWSDEEWDSYYEEDHTALSLKELEDIVEKKLFDMLLVSRKIPYNK